jgi:anaerobic C4-dicarboxylate transporter
LARPEFFRVLRANPELGRTLLLTGGGVGLGMIGGLGVTNVLRQFLFEVTPGDPTTFVLVSAVLLAVSCIAASMPARRALNVDAQVALRCE